MVEKITLTKIYRSNKDKQGNPLKTKDGREYTRIAIQTKEHGSIWISGFENKETAQWKEGDQVEVEVEQKGEYTNFKVPNSEDKIWKELNRLATEIVNLKRAFEQFQGSTQHDINVQVENDEEEPDLTELPF